MSECFPKQYTLRLVQAQMRCEDFLEAPIRHRTADEHRAGCYFIFPFPLSFYSVADFPDGNPVGCCDAAVDDFSRNIRLQGGCSVIWLFCPALLNELYTAPVDYYEVSVLFTGNHKRCPA